MKVRQRELETSALRILEKTKALSVPVPIAQVVELLGINLHHEALEDEVSGMLICKGKVSHIVVNSTHHPNRQRFTVAHECGHFVLHHLHGNRLFVDRQLQVYRRSGAPQSGSYGDRDSSTMPKEEAEANQFASALLMPKVLIEQHIRERALDLSDEIGVARLALAFGVSEQAMSIRLQHLELLSPA